MKTRLLSLSVVTVAAMSVSAQAAFVAYNDFGGTSPTGTTVYTLNTAKFPSTDTGLLKNFATNTNTTVTLSISTPVGYTSAEGDAGGSNGAMGAAGTDAYNIFNGKVDAKGYLWYNDTTTSRVRLTFSGLSASAEYTISLFSNRAGSYTDRYTISEIVGADSFVNTSSATATSASGALTTIMSGNNTASGAVAQYSHIVDSNGTFYIDVYGQGASGNTYKWYLNALQVTETDLATPEPASLGLLGMGVVALLTRKRK